jgi:hypothetical protein
MTLAWAAIAAQTMTEPGESDVPRYTVEVIIFQYAEDVSVGTEKFLPAKPVPPGGGEPAAGELTFGDPGAAAAAVEEEPGPDAPEFVLLVEEELTLTDIAGKLERLDVYEPVMHFAWTQVTRPEEETQPIDLQALAEPPEGMQGSFTLYLSRYLHLVVDLSLEQRSALADPVAIDDSGSVFRDRRGGATYDDLQAPPVRYRISEDRIFKSGDLRYFDHPKFGVLAKITRVEEADEEDADDGGLVGELGQ